MDDVRRPPLRAAGRRARRGGRLAALALRRARERLGAGPRALRRAGAARRPPGCWRCARRWPTSTIWRRVARAHPRCGAARYASGSPERSQRRGPASGRRGPPPETVQVRHVTWPCFRAGAVSTVASSPARASAGWALEIRAPPRNLFRVRAVRDGPRRNEVQMSRFLLVLLLRRRALQPAARACRVAALRGGRSLPSTSGRVRSRVEEIARALETDAARGAGRSPPPTTLPAFLDRRTRPRTAAARPLGHAVLPARATAGGAQSAPRARDRAAGHRRRPSLPPGRASVTPLGLRRRGGCPRAAAER